MKENIDVMKKDIDIMKEDIGEMKEDIDAVKEDTNEIGKWIDKYFHDTMPFPVDDELEEEFDSILSRERKK